MKGTQGSRWGHLELLWEGERAFLGGWSSEPLMPESEWLHFYLLNVLGFQISLFEKIFLMPQKVEVPSL